jgi:hypothetical protein
MSVQHKYRFKTEEEFIKEYGNEWRFHHTIIFNYDMDYLLGTDFIWGFIDGYECVHIPGPMGGWNIHKSFLLKKLEEPNYKPKKFIKEI